jgi:hypothetical protein
VAVGGIAVAVAGSGVGGSGVLVGGITAAAIAPATESASTVAVAVGSSWLGLEASDTPASVFDVGVPVGSREDRGAAGAAVFDFFAVGDGAGVFVLVATLAAKSTRWVESLVSTLNVSTAPTARTPAAMTKVPMRCRFTASLLAYTFR